MYGDYIPQLYACRKRLSRNRLVIICFLVISLFIFHRFFFPSPHYNTSSRSLCQLLLYKHNIIITHRTDFLWRREDNNYFKRRTRTSGGSSWPNYPLFRWPFCFANLTTTILLVIQIKRNAYTLLPRLGKSTIFFTR